MRLKFRPLAVPLLLVVGALAVTSQVALAQFAVYGPPTLSCEANNPSKTSILLSICGDASTGAPAGVSVHWKKCSDYAAALAQYGDGWTSEDGKLCELSLSGMPGRDHGSAESRWDLPPGGCEDIQIGGNLFGETGASGNCTDDLDCDECYVFRVRAHADRNAKHSVWSANIECRTASCNGGQCTRTQGYWGTHGPAGCDQTGSNVWPLASLTLGTVSYNQTQLCQILSGPPGNCGQGQGANALRKLAWQLIAARFNQAAGTNVSCITGALAEADALIGGLIVDPISGGTCVGENTVLGQQMDAVKTTLDQYNNGLLECAHHCAVPNGATGADGAIQGDASPTPVNAQSWGRLKVIYR